MARILTNKHNLPETLVKAVQYDTHKLAGTISVTTLIDAPQIRFLKSKYDHESDVIENIYALMGTALHHVLERSNIDSIRKRAFLLTADTLMSEGEKRSHQDPNGALTMSNAANWLFKITPILFPKMQQKYIFERTMRLQLGNDHVLSGTFDLYDKETGILYDYKFCSTYAYTFPESRKKWEKQTNIYAYMLMQEGFPVNEIRIVAFFRDWSEHKVLIDKDYPKTQIAEIPIHVWPAQETLKMINYHMDLHRQADIGNIIECSGEDRWAKADTYAVKNGTLKRSIRNFDSPAAAQSFVKENAHKYDKMYIETRIGGSLRCQKYCPVSKFCPQYRLELEKEAILKQNNPQT